jgi:CBS domain-containing protein
MKTCHEIMTHNPECCLASDKVYVVAQRMQSENIGALPVVENYDNKKLIGIITDRDLAIRVVGASQDATSTQVRAVMTHNLVVCFAGDELDTTIEIMAHNQIRRIPVVDENKRVVGIISQADVATRLENNSQSANMLEQISQPVLATSS